MATIPPIIQGLQEVAVLVTTGRCDVGTSMLGNRRGLVEMWRGKVGFEKMAMEFGVSFVVHMKVVH